MLNASVWRRFVKQQQGTCCHHRQGCRRPPPPGWAGTRAPLAWAFQRLRPQCCPRPTCSKLIVALAGCQSSAQAPQLMCEVHDFWSMAGSKFQVGTFVSVRLSWVSCQQPVRQSGINQMLLRHDALTCTAFPQGCRWASGCRGVAL